MHVTVGFVRLTDHKTTDLPAAAVIDEVVAGTVDFLDPPTETTRRLTEVSVTRAVLLALEAETPCRCWRFDRRDIGRRVKADIRRLKETIRGRGQVDRDSQDELAFLEDFQRRFDSFVLRPYCRVCGVNLPGRGTWTYCAAHGPAAYREANRLRQRKHRENLPSKPALGTSNLREHPLRRTDGEIDFDAEARAARKERRRVLRDA